MTDRPSRPSGGDASDADATVRLIEAAAGGDRDAAERLFARYLPELRQWARGRLPDFARDLNDTHDLVQETVVQVFRKLKGFEYRGEGSLRNYLRQALMNRIRNEIRRVRRRPVAEALDSGIEDDGASPVDAAMSEEALDAYEAALRRLRPEERELIVTRVELGCTYQEMADRLGKPSPDAARMGVARALVRLTEEMGRE